MERVLILLVKENRYENTHWKLLSQVSGSLLSFDMVFKLDKFVEFNNIKIYSHKILMQDANLGIVTSKIDHVKDVLQMQSTTKTF